MFKPRIFYRSYEYVGVVVMAIMSVFGFECQQIRLFAFVTCLVLLGSCDLWHNSFFHSKLDLTFSRSLAIRFYAPKVMEGEDSDKKKSEITHKLELRL